MRLRLTVFAFSTGLCVLGAAGACSSFGGEGEGGDVVPDASGRDADEVDAVATRDAAAADAEAGPLGPFCARRSEPAALCADFEDGRAFTAAIGPTTGTGVMAVEDAGFESAHALHAFSPQSGTIIYASADTPKAGSHSRTLSYAMRIAASVGTSAVTTDLVLNKDAPITCRFGLRLGSDVSRDQLEPVGPSGQSMGNVPITHNPANGTWFRVSLRLSTTTAAGVASASLVARVTIDGADALSAGEVVTNCPSSTLNAAPDLLQLGVKDVDNFGGDVFFDDVLLQGD
ncbi:MAG: hypothetical protein JWP97_3238 [Labilithrix sp.]|nr:hypothetical protein [Labilithrix sp.]